MRSEKALNDIIDRCTDRIKEIKDGVAVGPVTNASMAIVLDMIRDLAVEIKDVRTTLTQGFQRI